MNRKREELPIYSLHAFRDPRQPERQFQVEIFDANRHFQVKYPHRHDFFEVLFIKNGSGVHVIDDKKYTIEPPCVFFMSPGQAHKLELSHDIEGYIFIFNAEFYLLNRSNQNRLLEFPFFFTIQQNNPPLYLKDQHDANFLESLFKRAANKLTEEKTISVNLMTAMLDNILCSCADLYDTETKIINKGKGHLLVKRFYQLLEENYQNNLSINSYADMLAITPNHLSQTIKQLTGKSAKQIIINKQIIEIKRLLIHSNLGITEISNKMGFEDQSYFTKFFKKKELITPKAFRDKSMKTT